jgi:hypothetical protein
MAGAVTAFERLIIKLLSFSLGPVPIDSVRALLKFSKVADMVFDAGTHL